MGYAISLITIFGGPLLVFALFGWIHHKFVMLSVIGVAGRVLPHPSMP